MQFTVAAIAALAVGVQASYPVASNVTYTTEVVSVYTTYCPAATQITYGSKTYTVTEATTLTITDCPCTISKPVYTTSAVVCKTCTGSASASLSSSAAVYPTTTPVAYPTTYANGTATVSTSVKSTGAVPTTTGAGSTSTSAVPTAGAAKVAALSGAGLLAMVAALL